MKPAKEISRKDSVPLSDIIRKKMKDPEFKETFLREMARVDLAVDLKTLRTKKRMTQQQVAAKADMPQSVIARMESGRHSPSLATLQKVASVFNKRVGLVEQPRGRREKKRR